MFELQRTHSGKLVSSGNILNPFVRGVIIQSTQPVHY